MKIPFVKMQGAGNDYVYVNGRDLSGLNLSRLAVKLSDRRFGIGSDGLVILYDSDDCDAEMRMFNADGSEGNICGNALRCAGKLVTESSLKDYAVIKTKVGAIKVVKLSENRYETEFGKYAVLPDFSDGQTTYKIIDVGNLHAVAFVKETDGLNIEKKAKRVAENARFKGGVNVEYASFDKKGNIRVRVYERGSGETLSCGSGSVAVAVAVRLSGKIKKEYSLTFRGGVLKVKFAGCDAYLSGEAKRVYSGYVDV